MTLTHVPVMREEVLDALQVEKGKRYIDATVGGGGYAVEIVTRGGNLLGIDTDPTAVTIATDRLKALQQGTWNVVQGNFRNIEEIATREGYGQVQGIVFDLGVSSIQLDTPERGFSYRFTDAPLDLRMNPESEGETAAQLVNRLTAESLYDIFSSYGEEQLARVLADTLYRARTLKKIETTGDIVRIIEQIVPESEQRVRVLSRVFQALRIAVNDELSSLKQGLLGASKLIVPGGRLVVVSFHSLEDRIVKQFMRSQSDWKVITKHPLRPTLAEMQVNIRSRSGKVRIAEKYIV